MFSNVVAFVMFALFSVLFALGAAYAYLEGHSGFAVALGILVSMLMALRLVKVGREINRRRQRAAKSSQVPPSDTEEE